ncbi:ribonuclease P protein subunit p25-like protein [Orussus abietinus]|uniref:ribonuclease P protein subunit p25-like protein n=1 Tax=Orussus abietinus TaxID=222816 RepID=UPI0006262F37|nr:ribonuclease P protein subunit p25-like protein [Orussus abietinus]
MAKSRKKKKLLEKTKSPENDTREIPIPGLPEKYLWMRVRSSTKMRNVLGYALKEFKNHHTIVWTGSGEGINKAITYAEIFKRKNPNLGQITKLRCVEQKKETDLTEQKTDDKKGPPAAEIHILLSRKALDTKELGYQAAGAMGTFPDEAKESEKRGDNPECSKRTSLAVAEFAAMGLRIGQKRMTKEQYAAMSKRKKLESDK